MYGKLVAIVCGVALSFSALADVRPMKEDKTHVNTWNDFATALFQLHKRQLKGRKIRKTSVVGGYSGRPAFYKEVSYIDADSGKMLSRIQWEKENPTRIHTIEVFIYDKQGRMVREFSAAFLPDYRNAPTQTLINFYAYNGKLTGMRQFDAGNDLIYENCKGEFKGKKVNIRLFEEDLHGSDSDIEKLMKSKLYKTCMKGLPAKAGKYLMPQ